MTHESQLNELLKRWQRLRRQGRITPAEELCADCPELIDPLRQRLQALNQSGGSPESAAGPQAQVADLLRTWKVLYDQGQPITVEELCRDCPQLQEEVKEQIQDLEVMSHLSRVTVPEGETPSRGVHGHEERPGNEQPPRTLGRYRLDRLVGRGGFGQVWQAFDPELRRMVAIKVPRPDLAFTPEHLDRFMEEARKAASLKHPAIVPVYDVCRRADTCFIISEFIDGRSLAEQIAQDRPSPLESAHMVAEVAGALHLAHLQGLVHRDVKPGNILLDRGGNPYLTDFGLAASEEDQLLEGAGVLGTFAYMSPEQARGASHHVDARSDIYSLGVVFYELLTGRLPFRGNTALDYRDQILRRDPRPPRTIDDTIPKELERICLKCLSKRVHDRYTTAADLADDLREFLSQTTSKVAPAVLPAPTRRLPSPRTLIAGAVALTLVAMVGVVAFSSRPKQENPDPARVGPDPKANPIEPPNIPPGAALLPYPDVLRNRPWNLRIPLFKEDCEPLWTCRLLGQGNYKPLKRYFEVWSSTRDTCTLFALDDDPQRRWFEFSVEVAQLESFTPGEVNLLGVFFGWRLNPGEQDSRNPFFVVQVDERPVGPEQQGRVTVGWAWFMPKNQIRGEVQNWLSPLPPGVGTGTLSLKGPRDWRMLRVRAVDDRVTVTVNDGPKVEFTMGELRKADKQNDLLTLQPRGALGVWASRGKGWFRNATITALPSEAGNQ